MKANALPAAYGRRWLADGYRLFRRSPATLLLMVGAYWLTLLLLNIIPVIGAAMASLLIPGLSVGLMNGCRDLDSGRTPPPSRLYSGFRENRQTLINLGLIYALASMAIVMLVMQFDDGALLRALPTGRLPESENGEAELAAIALVAGLTPLVAAFWFGPMLAAWHRLGAGKALFFSLVACWLNWRAFLMYGLMLVLLCVLAPMLVLVVAALILPDALLGIVAIGVSVPLLLVLMPVVFASFYISYRDVFQASPHE